MGFALEAVLSENTISSFEHVILQRGVMGYGPSNAWPVPSTEQDLGVRLLRLGRLLGLVVLLCRSGATKEIELLALGTRLPSCVAR